MSAAAEEVTTPSELDAWRDLILSEERRELVDTVRRHLAARFPLDVVRGCFESRVQPAAAWSEVAGADYPSVGLPEEAGGVGSFVDVAALLEAAGQALVPAPLLATVLSLQTLCHLDGAPGLEPGRAAALAEGATTGTGLRSGRVVVLDGALAERLTLVVPHPDGTTVAQLDVAALEPLEVHAHVDPSRPAAVFHLAGVEPVHVVEDSRAVDTVLAPARTALAADLTGVATGALEGAVRQALVREQFGKKIGAFQGVKHRLADVYVAVERARSLTRAAAVAITGGLDSGVELSLLAKAASTEAAVDATGALVQVLGAMGMTFESDAHLFFRRAQQTAPFLGSAASCYRRAVLARRGESA